MIKPDAIYKKSVYMYVIICMHLLNVCNMLILAPEAPVRVPSLLSADAGI